MVQELTPPLEALRGAVSEPFAVAGLSAVVTGGAMGIGHGIAARLTQAGANVVIADIDLDLARAAREALADAPGRAVEQLLDVRDEVACRDAIDRCVAEFGAIDLLVNDAGIFPTSPVLEMSAEMFDKVLSVNLKGLFYMCKAAGKRMAEAGRGGKIVNISSIDALHPSFPGLAAYDASKGGVWSFTKNFALEMAPYGVTVNTLAPGGITTEGTQKGLEGITKEQSEAMTAAFTARIPLGRMGVPDDIAKVVLFLCSPAADYMTGSIVVVDGGMLLT